MHPLSSIISDRRTLRWEEVDIIHFIQHWLAQRLHTDLVYCDRLKDGIATIRVGSALHYQEVLLLKHDLAQQLKAECGYTLKELKVGNR